jgi:hypothetical protein
MISKSISVSEQVNILSDFAALLFTWLIPHTDDYGVIPGSSRKIKALVVPMRKQTPDQVENALKELQNAGLVWRYIYKDAEYIQFCKFEDHQEGLHKRTNPKNPLYRDAKDDTENFREIPGNSRLKERNLNEINLSEGKGKEDKVAYSQHVRMTEEQFDKLVLEHGQAAADWMVNKLNTWKLANGKTKVHGCDYSKILNWVVKAYNEEQRKQGTNTGSRLGMINDVIRGFECGQGDNG